ncbi:DNA methyltransferase [Cyanobium sp. PCC 7001]|uniref:DNA methyltransferase n=1 Tax=Cyanobium sp. PCC 7001 TaxID=180281 RepID=UPI0008FEE94E
MSNRHPFHSLCPYFAMFPEEFVEHQVLTYTTPGDVVFDPFCGRGTTVFESLLHGRPSYGVDINPVAACIAGAKAEAPSLQSIFRRINELEESFTSDPILSVAPSPFFEACYERNTLAEILFLREHLQWRHDQVDRFIAALTLGVLHGESHRSDYCLSNRMPRTISTKPDYSIRWWAERGLQPPRRRVFDVLRNTATFRFRAPSAEIRGMVRQADARDSAASFPEICGKVRLVVTSPPYLDTTDYAEDQWLRLWFLGGAPFPELRKNPDDRHTRIDRYWQFLCEAWAGVIPLLSDHAVIVVRIGGAKLTKDDLFRGVTQSLRDAAESDHGRSVQPVHEGVTSSIRPREVRAFRPATSRANVEHDFAYELSYCPAA